MSKNLNLGYKQAFSQEIYTIEKIYNTLPPRYLVKDEEGDILDSNKYDTFLPFLLHF